MPTLEPFDYTKHKQRDVFGQGYPSTEYTITVPMPDGTVANIPSIWWDSKGNPHFFGNIPKDGDPVVDEERAIKEALKYEKESGLQFPRYTDFETAGKAAGMRSQQGGANVAPLASQPFEMTEDPYAQARGLMDLIGSKESRNDYNIAAGGSKNKFTDMTINDVLDWQRKNKNKAVGRYQIIPDTMDYLKNTLGLKGSEKFDEALQDQMFVELLRRRGYDDWSSGNLTDEGFANLLAKEWAAMPVMSDMQGHKRPVKAGESYYSGVGTNKALISPQDVLSALSLNKPEYATMDELLGAHDFFGTTIE